MGYTKDEVREIVDSEGLGYAVLDYMSGDQIEDPELRQAWVDANLALGRLQKLLWEES